MVVFFAIIICVMCIAVGFGCGYSRCYRYAKKRIDSLEAEKTASQIREVYWKLFLDLKLHDMQIRSFLDLNNMCEVAIYGYGVIGKYLEKELFHEGVKVVFAVDRGEKKDATIPIYVPSAKLPPYDVMLVTTGNAGEVRELVGGTVNTVIELEDILKVI